LSALGAGGPRFESWYPDRKIKACKSYDLQALIFERI